MRVGFLIPTDLESKNIGKIHKHVICAGYGSGKAAACSAAAKLIYEKYCDTIIVWGLAGGLSDKAKVNDILIAEKVAYRDYNISPLMGSTGVGWVKDFSENLFADLDQELCNLLLESVKKIFPERNVVKGSICTGDQFVQHNSRESYNRVEKDSDAVDMESAAVVQFCRNVDKNVKVGIIRVISDNADHSAHIDFNEFISKFTEMNSLLFDLRFELKKTGDNDRIVSAIRDFPDFPIPGVLFKDIWGIISNRKILEETCHKLYDAFCTCFSGERITKVAGIESRGFLFGLELAKLFQVPFVPIRKSGKLPGKIITETYKTEYSTAALEIQDDAFLGIDNVVIVDDIIATGGSLIAARKAILKAKARCEYAIVAGRISSLNGIEILTYNGMKVISLLDL